MAQSSLLTAVWWGFSCRMFSLAFWYFHRHVWTLDVYYWKCDWWSCSIWRTHPDDQQRTIAHSWPLVYLQCLEYCDQQAAGCHPKKRRWAECANSRWAVRCTVSCCCWLKSARCLNVGIDTEWLRGARSSAGSFGTSLIRVWLPWRWSDVGSLSARTHWDTLSRCFRPWVDALCQWDPWRTAVSWKQALVSPFSNESPCTASTDWRCGLRHRPIFGCKAMALVRRGRW